MPLNSLNLELPLSMSSGFGQELETDLSVFVLECLSHLRAKGNKRLCLSILD